MERLLIVDDDPRLREMLREQLELSGFSITEAEDGPTALRAAESPGISLVLLDVMMPGQDGLAVLKELRSRESTRRLPVVLLTARSQMGDKLQGLELGADDYITKPFDPAELLARVRAQLRLRRLTLEVEERNEELQRFAAAVAHEVRGPLNELGLHLDQAKALALAPGVSPILQRAEDALKRAADVLAVHLQIARAGHVPDPRVKVPLLAALREAEDQVRVDLAVPTFQLRLSGAPGTVSGNATLLAELFRNLLENAVRHGGAKGGASVTFSTEAGRSVVAIEDQGSGIRPDVVATLFSPFRSGGGGSGLGLVIARRIARGHGGDLTYAPLPEGDGKLGARFEVWLPEVRD